MSDTEATTEATTADEGRPDEQGEQEGQDADGSDESLLVEKAVDLGAKPEAHPHPAPSAYVGIAVILAVATAVEIALFYLEEDLSETIVTVSLLVLMVIKFLLVALWFMHLRFEARIFRQFFYGGAILAVVAYGVVLAASHVFPFGA